MSLFDDLFGGLGPAYEAMVRAHLQIKAEDGSEEAAWLLNGQTGDETPSPGDVVLADDVIWVWDSADGQTWQWWSPERRESVETIEPDGSQPIVWHGRPQMPDAAKELFDAVEWGLNEHQLCLKAKNPKTGATFYRAMDVHSVSQLVDMYRFQGTLQAVQTKIEAPYAQDDDAEEELGVRADTLYVD